MQVMPGDTLAAQPPGTLYQEVFVSGVLGEVRILQASIDRQVSYVPLLPVLELAMFDHSGLPTIHHPEPQDVFPDRVSGRSFVVWEGDDVQRLVQILLAPSRLRHLRPLELHLEQDPITHTWQEAVLIAD